MKGLLGASRAIDWIGEGAGRLASVLVLFVTQVCVGNAVLRYGFHMGSNAWVEFQATIFGAIVYLGAAQTLRLNEHVRVDAFYATCSERTRAWIDIFGLLLLLMPLTIFMGWLSFGTFWSSLVSGEASANAGGIAIWPAKAVIPLGFALLVLQGISELVKRCAVLTGHLHAGPAYEKPLQ